MIENKTKKLIRLYTKKLGSEKAAILFLNRNNPLLYGKTPLKYAMESDFNYGQIEFLADKLQK